MVAAAASPVAKQTAAGQAPKDDLASSLAAHFAEQKKNELEVEPQHSLTDNPRQIGGPISSAMDSVHRSKHAAPQFPIAPEDRHQEVVRAPSASTNATSHSTVAARWKKSLPQSHPERN